MRQTLTCRSRRMGGRWWVLAAATAMAVWSAPARAAAQALPGQSPGAQPGPATMERDRYTVLGYENGGLLVRSTGLNRTFRVAVSPTECEGVPGGTQIEVGFAPQMFGFPWNQSFCRIIRAEEPR